MQQYLLSVQNFIFSNKEFKVYGTNENPLFLVNDIICELLGMDRPTDNYFLRDNRNRKKYVVAWEFPTSSLELQERFKKSNKEHIYFFTEKGLYRCLMRSNKPIAEYFYDEICDLIKNIRLGVVSIQVQKIEELERYLTVAIQERDHHLNDLLESRISLSDYYQQVIRLQEDNSSKQYLIDKATVSKILYEIQTEKGRYIGICEDFDRRLNYHLNKSCNPHVREAVSLGRVSMRIIDRVNCLTKDDAKYIERKAILAVPEDQRLNIRVPRPNEQNITLARVVSDYQSEEEKDDLTAISEAHTEDTHQLELNPYSLLYSKPQILVNALKQVDYLRDYLKENNGMYPKKRSVGEEHELAVLVARIRKELTGKLYTAVTQARLIYLKYYIPDFKLSGVEDRFEQSVSRLKDFYTKYYRVPAYGGPVAGEKTIYGIMQRIKQAYAENDKEYLTPDRLDLVLEYLSFIELKPRNFDAFTYKVKTLKEFYDKTGRIPLKKNKEEKTLHSLYYTIKDYIYPHDSYYKEKIAIVQYVYPEMMQ